MSTEQQTQTVMQLRFMASGFRSLERRKKADVLDAAAKALEIAAGREGVDADATPSHASGSVTA